MRIVNLSRLPRAPWPGQRLRVDHASLLGLDSGLDPGELVVLRVRGTLHRAVVLRVSFGLDETVYDLQVGTVVEPDGLDGLDAAAAEHRQWEADDVMAVLCRLKRTGTGCEETCSACALNPDSPQGWMLQRAVRDLG
jgi:hypothetical protein